MNVVVVLEWFMIGVELEAAMGSGGMYQCRDSGAEP